MDKSYIQKNILPLDIKSSRLSLSATTILGAAFLKLTLIAFIFKCSKKAKYDKICYALVFRRSVREKLLKRALFTLTVNLPLNTVN